MVGGVANLESYTHQNFYLNKGLGSQLLCQFALDMLPNNCLAEKILAFTIFCATIHYLVVSIQAHHKYVGVHLVIY